VQFFVDVTWKFLIKQIRFVTSMAAKILPALIAALGHNFRCRKGIGLDDSRNTAVVKAKWL
jgi:hypothetical protein